MNRRHNCGDVGWAFFSPWNLGLAVDVVVGTAA